MKDSTGPGSMRWRNKCIEMYESAKLVNNGNNKFLKPVVMILQGYALELGLKAVYALEKKERPVKYKHGITALAKELKFELSDLENNLLDVLQDYIVWAGRYPETMAHKAEDYRKVNDKISKVFYEKKKLGSMEIMVPSALDSFRLFEVVLEKILYRYDINYSQGTKKK